MRTMTRLKDLSPIGKLSMFIFAFFATFITYAAVGKTLQISWNWFVPALFNLPSMSFKQGIVIMMITDWFVICYKKISTEDEEVTVEGWMGRFINRTVVFPFFFLIVAYVFKILYLVP